MPMCAIVFLRHCRLHIFIFVQMKICGDFCACFSAFARRVTRYFLLFIANDEKAARKDAVLTFFVFTP